MSLLIQKFGGTSLADKEGRENLCRKVLAARDAGHDVVVVVSAMGRLGDPYATDTLLELLSDIPGGADSQVADLMASAGEVISSCLIATLLTSKGCQALPLTAYTAGIAAAGPFGDAAPSKLESFKISSVLSSGIIPVVTGFQGVDVVGRIHTFGRGGSDTTAVAIGAALGADYVDIYKDVPGVAKADPRVIPDAPFMDFLDYESMFLLSRHGARVLHDKSALIARERGVTIRIRSTFDEGAGTTIGGLVDTHALPDFIGLATAPGVDASLIVSAVFSPIAADFGVAKALGAAAICGLPAKHIPSGDQSVVSFACDSSYGKQFARKLFHDLMAG